MTSEAQSVQNWLSEPAGQGNILVGLHDEIVFLTSEDKEEHVKRTEGVHIDAVQRVIDDEMRRYCEAETQAG
jgi:hypothetical protein